MAYGGEYTDEARQVFADLLARRDSLPTLPATSRMTVCPLTKHGSVKHGMAGCGHVDKLPAHVSCNNSTNPNGMCFCWSGCDDPDCDHPACGGRGWREFQDAWVEAGGTVDHYLGGAERILVWTTPWVEWIEAGRHRELLEEEKRSELVDATKLLRKLERGPLYPVKLGEGYLDMEIALYRQGIAMEQRTVAESNMVGLAYDVVQGATSLEAAQVSGSITSELRLAEAVSLEVAPDGYQGALF